MNLHSGEAQWGQLVSALFGVSQDRSKAESQFYLKVLRLPYSHKWCLGWEDSDSWVSSGIFITMWSLQRCGCSLIFTWQFSSKCWAGEGGGERFCLIGLRWGEVQHLNNTVSHSQSPDSREEKMMVGPISLRGMARS